MQAQHSEESPDRQIGLERIDDADSAVEQFPRHPRHRGRVDSPRNLKPSREETTLELQNAPIFVS